MLPALYFFSIYKFLVILLNKDYSEACINHHPNFGNFTIQENTLKRQRAIQEDN